MHGKASEIFKRGELVCCLQNQILWSDLCYISGQFAEMETTFQYCSDHDHLQYIFKDAVSFPMLYALGWFVYTRSKRLEICYH